ncbi:MAG: IPExxxVDY family protein [Bacteroidales bacterium]
MKKRVHKLASFEAPTPVRVIGIASHENDYRFSWALNQELGLQLQKSDYLVFEEKKQETVQSFSLYKQRNKDSAFQYIQINNKCEAGFFLKRHKNIDFILLIAGDLTETDHKQLITKLNAMDMILAAFPIEELSTKEQARIQESFQ